MCGIAGLLGAEPGSFAERLLPALAHRGPDDAGQWHDGDACLVQTRLAILDLSPAGHQPMASPCGRWWLVFNGEIYNHAELRQRLEAEGERFIGSGDTEVLLRWLVRRGEEGLRELRGMFAFCLFDRQARRALLARDPHGIKPLYVWQGPRGELAFASELRALLASEAIPRRVDAASVAAYLASGSVPEPGTLVEGVRRLGAGERLRWQRGLVEEAPWWPLPESLLVGEEPPPAATIHDRAAAIALTRSALGDSVAAHMVSDVPVGLFLSAGLDSAALLALAPPGLHTFTIGFGEVGTEAFDESEPAARIASLFGARHTTLRLEARQARQWLPPFLASQDQPSLDGFNTWCVARLASEEGLKVALSGLGGDELFGGYPSFQAVPRLWRWRRRAGWLGPPGAALLAALPGGAGAKRQRIAQLLRQPPSLQAAHRCLRGLFSPGEVERLMEHWGLAAPPRRQRQRQEAGEEPPRGLDPADAVAWLEGCRYLRNQLLCDSDTMAMAAALELRLPFVDAHLQRRLAPIAPALRLARGKALLQDSVPELPAWFTARPKQGFRFPFQLWLDDPTSPLDLQVPSTPKGLDLGPWYRRWSLMVLANWLHHHLAFPLPQP